MRSGFGVSGGVENLKLKISPLPSSRLNPQPTTHNSQQGSAFFLLLVFLQFFSTPLSADTVILKNGNHVRGIVIKEDKRKVILKFDKEAKIQFSRREVTQIVYDSREERESLLAEWEKKSEPPQEVQAQTPTETSRTTPQTLPPLSPIVSPSPTTKESQLLLSEGTWQVRKTEHFIVYYQDPVEGKAVSDRAEYHLEKIVDDLRLRRTHDWRKKYTVCVVKEESEWKSFLVKLNITPELTGGFSTGPKGEIFLHGTSVPYLQLAFPHELTHTLLSEIGGGKRFPLWFDEGFANYEGGIIGTDEGLLREAIQSGKHFPLSELVQSKSYPTDIEKKKLFYTESESLVEYLITQHGRRRFGEFIEELLKTDDFEQALRTAYGGKIGSLDELSRLWLRYVSE